MQKHYIQSISTFAVAIPLIVTLAIILIILGIKSSLIGDFPKKQAKYAQELKLNKQLHKVEKENASKKDQLTQWSDIMTGDSYTKVNDSLLSAIKLNNKTGTLHVLEKSRSGRKITGVNALHSACDFTLQGTFSELQRSLTLLESSMPNLMTNNLSLSPQVNGKLLTLKINYTVWKQ